MTESDDIFGGGGGGDEPEMPVVQAQAVKKTAARVGDQSSEKARKNRLKKASFLAEGFSTPKLGVPGGQGDEGTL